LHFPAWNNQAHAIFSFPFLNSLQIKLIRRGNISPKACTLTNLYFVGQTPNRSVKMAKELKEEALFSKPKFDLSKLKKLYTWHGFHLSWAPQTA